MGTGVGAGEGDGEGEAPGLPDAAGGEADEPAGPGSWDGGVLPMTATSPELPGDGPAEPMPLAASTPIAMPPTIAMSARPKTAGDLTGG